MAARTAGEWFALYGESHKNPTNKKIHWICVPAIFITTVGLIWAIPPGPLVAIGALLPPALAPWLNWATVLVIPVGMVFYLSMSWTIFVGMALALALTVLLLQGLASGGPVALVSVCAPVWVAAWIAQFIGHQIEGKKPSFLRDLQFLLVGPAWLLGHVYARLGIPL